MAEEATSTAPVDAPASTTTAPETSATITSETNGVAHVTKEDEELAGKQATSEVTAPDGKLAEVAVPPSAVDVESGSAAAKKEKRKSTSGIPEHKNKGLKKKKSMPNLHLNCKPGDYYWARLKGYPPWPSIICDEQMIPELLLGTRPVSTTRPDGSIRDDFKEGGKNAKERTFPIMFLYTNEFSWIVNTSLSPLDPEECKGSPKTKMTKTLTAAYELAAENHGIDYFKDLLQQWQEDEKAIDEEMRELREQEEADHERAEAEKSAAANEASKESDKKVEKKKKARKSKVADEADETAGGEAPKSSKKRKKDAESDNEAGKPKKTPKVTKLNVSKTPNGEASAKKSRKKVVQPDEDEVEQQPQMTEEERMAAREKAVLYLRHRLQKGFLFRDQAPQESEMSVMADFFAQLENYENLEASILKKTKIHKVLKGIVKLSSIPKDDEYNFKKRSAAMLEIWNMRMDAADMEAPAVVAPSKSQEPETNGQTLASDGGAPKVENETKEDAEKTTETAEQTANKIEEKVELSAAADEEITKPDEVPVETSDAPASGEVDNEGDVSMQSAPEVATDNA